MYVLLINTLIIYNVSIITENKTYLNRKKSFFWRVMAFSFQLTGPILES